MLFLILLECLLIALPVSPDHRRTRRYFTNEQETNNEKLNLKPLDEGKQEKT